jgi:hypothetical protein
MSRPSPPYPAQDCKGSKKQGKDGQWYISVPTSKGVYRWKPASTKKAKGVTFYEIHDNGGRPFVVEVNSTKKEVEVFLNEWMEGGSYIKGKSIYHTRYKVIFIGENKAPDREWIKEDKGNSILLHVSGSTYVYIGSDILSFQTHDGEKIKRYYSPIGNSDSPYPYAIGEHHTYFMLDMETLPNEFLDLKIDGYGQFYGFDIPNPDRYGYKKKLSEKERKVHVKKIINPKKRKVPHRALYRG